MPKKLKPCPFCGGETKELKLLDATSIACEKCGCRTPFDCRENVVKIWNRRADKKEFDICDRCINNFKRWVKKEHENNA